MSVPKKSENDVTVTAVKTKMDRPPKIASSKSTGEITIKHRKIDRKDTATNGSTTERGDRDKKDKEKDKKEKKKSGGDPSKKDKKKRDSIRLSKSVTDPNVKDSESNATDLSNNNSSHTINSPNISSHSVPNIKTDSTTGGSRSKTHSRQSSKEDHKSGSLSPRKATTPRSARMNELMDSADEHTDEDKQTIATLKLKRDQFIRTISTRKVQLPIHVKEVFMPADTIEELSDSESSSSGMDWEDPNFELQIDKRIKELGEPLPEETMLLSNLQSLLKVPAWKNETWIQSLQEEKDKTDKDTKRKSLNNDAVETHVRRSSMGPLSSPSSSKLDTPGTARANRAASASTKPLLKNKVGYVLLKSKLGPWKRRYLILDESRLLAKKSPDDSKPKLVIPMLFSQCKSIDKPLSGKRKLYMFEIFTPDTKFLMASDNQQSSHEWVSAIQKACDSQMLQSLDLQETSQGSADNEVKPEVKELLEILALPGNNVCTDCDAVDPEWAVINIGNFVCIDCSGVHRALGVQISKVRSIYLDNWEPEAVAYMKTMGNKKVNEIWEYNVPSYREKPRQTSTREKRMFWIVSKYVKKEFFDWSRASEVNVSKEQQQSISTAVIAAKMIPSDMAELKKAILTLVKEDEGFRTHLKELIFSDSDTRQTMETDNERKDKDKGRNRATTTTAL